MATDGQSHKKKLKTENDKLKHELKELKKALKLKNKIQQQNNSMYRELCPHCPKSNKIYINFTTFEPTLKINIQNKSTK